MDYTDVQKKEKMLVKLPAGIAVGAAMRHNFDSSADRLPDKSSDRSSDRSAAPTLTRIIRLDGLICIRQGYQIEFSLIERTLIIIKIPSFITI